MDTENETNSLESRVDDLESLSIPNSTSYCSVNLG